MAAFCVAMTGAPRFRCYASASHPWESTEGPAAPRTPLGPVRRKPMEQIYGIRVERGAAKERLEQLGVAKWSSWEAGDCWYTWDWKVDEWVYVESGSLVVYPKWSDLSGRYEAGDLVRFPKWFDAALIFKGDYRQRYKFVAYGDTELD